jgi:hypothetical protein
MPMAQSSLGSPGLLSAGARAAGDIAADRSFARDLNLDQIVAAIAFGEDLYYRLGGGFEETEPYP